jgi:hypothetical protein
VQGLADPRRRIAPPAGDDARAFVREHARRRLADPFGRAGDDAHALFEAELHGRLR